MQIVHTYLNDDKIIVTNEPARIVDVGVPDYSISKGGVDIC